MPLSGIEFLGAGILRITCDSGKCNTWGDIPWRSVPPNVLETFCHCNDWMCDEIHIEGYWRILRVTFKGAAVSLPTPFCWRISGCIASVKWVFLAIIYLVETCADSSCREIVREQAAEPGKSEGRKGRKLPWLVVFRCLSLLLLDWRPENGMIIPCLTFIQGGAPAC